MEEAKSRKLGGSLKVPNVQELAKQTLAAVPPRYIRDDIENQSYNSSMLLPQIPIIDMKKLLQIGDDDELKKLHLACKDWGFFQVIYFNDIISNTVHFIGFNKDIKKIHSTKSKRIIKSRKFC